MRANSVIWYVLSAGLLYCACHNNERIFRLRTATETGIDFQNTIVENDSINPLDMEFLYNGGGVAVGDLNGDGRVDIFFSGNQVSNRCYLNLGGLRFIDVTKSAGLESEGIWANGASMADVNADGRLDIYVCNTIHRDPRKRKNRLYINEGNDGDGRPVFREMAEQYGLADTSFSVQGVFFDYDLDGDLDLYLVNTRLAARQSASFQQSADTARSDYDRLYRNDLDSVLGHPVFTDLSAEAGIDGAGFGLGVAVSDLNRDGWPDIYVTNDYFSNDVLYINQRNGRFRNDISSSLMHTSQNAMGCDAADLNNDGWSDLMAVDMRPEDHRRRQKNMGPNGYFMHQNMASGFLYWQYVHNTFQLNMGPIPREGGGLGPPRFAEIAFQLGMAETDWSWNVVMADMDLDGRRDVMITNGYPKDVTDRDFGSYRSRNAGKESKAQLIEQMPSIEVANYAFRQENDMEFRNQRDAWGMSEESFSNGAVAADLDLDGDLDYVVNNINAPAFVYENLVRSSDTAKRGFLELSFEGPPGNPSGIGARVDLFLAGGGRQMAENFPVRGYLSAQPPVVYFGLGQDVIDSIQVEWPGGAKQILRGPLTGRQKIAFALSSVKDTLTGNRSMYFEEVTAALGIPFRHQEMDFSDFDVERLLPWKLSRQGPKLCKADVNQDGLEDFFVTGSVDFSGVLFLQKVSGGFSAKELDVRNWPGIRQRETTDAIFLDADADGDMDLYTVSGSNEFSAGSPAYQDLLWINNGTGGFSPDTMALPYNPTSGSVVRSVDIDGDKDLDLFIGGRCLPGKYPAPVSSFLYRNDGKPGAPKFTDVTLSKAPGLLNIGMVTDAVWVSLRAEGPPSLVIVGEWMAPLRFDWQQGRLLPVDTTSVWSNLKGFWQSIYAEDLDGDGDQDLIIGNRGWNSVFGPGQRWPVRLYDADIDRNGISDPMIAFQEAGQGEVPLAFRDDWIAQAPGLRKRFTGYRDFGLATAKEVIGEDALSTARVLEAREMGSIILWNQEGNFAVAALPWLAQSFPVTDILVMDVNADGLRDLVLCGNDYGNDVTNGRLDAGSGLVVLQDTLRQFKTTLPYCSGLYIPGDAKSMILVKTSVGDVLVTASQGELLHAFRKIF